MLDVLWGAIGCVFKRASNASAPRLGLFANRFDLRATLGSLFFGVTLAKLGYFGARRFFGSSPLLSSHRFTSTLDGIVRIRKASRILTMLALAAIFAIALYLTAAGSATRIIA